MLASKSKLMKSTVPWNEFSAIMFGKELIYLVAKSMGKKGSTITLSWCCNPTKKLRLFVFSRVETIRRMIEWTTGRDYLPIYHVNGTMNLVDLLMKKHELTVGDLSTGSDWQTGRPWMRLNTKDMPLSLYQSLTITREVEEVIEEECFKNITLLSEPLTLEKNIPGLGTGVNLSVSLGIVPSPPPQRL